MKNFVLLMLVIVPSISLAGCFETTSNKGPPAWMEKECAPLKKFPERATKQKTTESYMRADISQYTKCRHRHRSLRDYHRARDGRSV